MEQISKKSAIVQLTFTFILTIQTAMMSFCCVWPSYSLKTLESKGAPLGFSLSKHESNLVGSLPMLGALFSIPVSGVVCEAIGRKKTLILTSLFFVVAWSLILTAKTSAQILIGRLLLGIGFGITQVVVFVFITEITHLSVRGSAASILGLMFNVGILVSYLLGWFCSYNVICYLCVTECVLYTVIASCLKDTPPYLLRNGQEKEALISLKFYRGTSKSTEEILTEFSYLKSLGAYSEVPTDLETSPSFDKEKEKSLYQHTGFVENPSTMNPLKLLLTVDYNRRALISIVCLMALSVLIGMIAVQTYARTFFSMAAPTISPDLCSVVLALVFVLSSGLTVVVTNKLSRRFLMIATCLTSSVCLFVLGSLLRWQWGPVWLAPAVILLYCFAFPMGCMNVAFVQLSECFGPQVNSTATTIVLCSLSAINFVVLSIFVPSVELLGIDGTFFMFAALGFLATVVSYFIVKETRHVPLEEVQKMFAKGYLYRKE